MATPDLHQRMTWLAQRLRYLAERALERRDTHPDDSTSYHYENAVVDCYGYAARMIDLELAQGDTVAQASNVVPFSSVPQAGMNLAQSAGAR